MSQDPKSPRVTAESLCSCVLSAALIFASLPQHKCISLSLTLKGVGWFAKKSQNVGRPDCPAAAFLWSVSEKWQHYKTPPADWPGETEAAADDSKSCHSQRDGPRGPGRESGTKSVRRFLPFALAGNTLIAADAPVAYIWFSDNGHPVFLVVIITI
jgi:hypothetical protein